MANSPQAIKRARQNEKRRALKQSQRSMLRTHLKNCLKLIDAKQQDAASVAFRLICKLYDRYATRGVIPKNKAAKVKSRINKRIKAMVAS